MNGSTARELRRLAKHLRWTKGQYRAAKRKLVATPRDRRGAALAELRAWNDGVDAALAQTAAAAAASA